MKAVGAIILAIGLMAMGARAETLTPPKTTRYPDVQDVPARQEKPAMTADELTKLKQDLSAARDRQHQPEKNRQKGPLPKSKGTTP
jgi:hypothetical protein